MSADYHAQAAEMLRNADGSPTLRGHWLFLAETWADLARSVEAKTARFVRLIYWRQRRALQSVATGPASRAKLACSQAQPGHGNKLGGQEHRLIVAS